MNENVARTAPQLLHRQRPYAVLSKAVLLAASMAFSAMVEAQTTAAAAQLDRPSGIFDGAINDYVVNPSGAVVRHIGDEWGYADTYGLAGFGVLKASAVASATGELYGRFFARSSVAFYDSLMFASDSHAGEGGSFTASIVFDRRLSNEGNAVDGYAATALNVGTNFESFNYTETLWLQPSGCVPGVTPGCRLDVTTTQDHSSGIAVHWQSPTVLELTIAMTFGESTDLNVTLDTYALASYWLGSSKWTSDASHSFYWGGITAVADSTGSPVAYSLASASGTDYSHSFAPVPEPETWALMLAGIGLLAAMVRRGRDGSRA